MTSTPRNKGSRALILSAVLFGLYVINVLAGKASVLFGASTPFNINDVAEFLLLFGASMAFVVATLMREGGRTDAETTTENEL
ncbi:MAG: hypothetical protein KDE22_03105 [Rhodobacterales bacterium]|nr:hypothetical protein [Rhodobacterales bacterium]